MAETEASPAPPDWFVRLVLAIPLAPAWTGVAVAALVYGLFVLWDEAFAVVGGQAAHWRFWQGGSARTEPAFAVLIGFLFGIIQRSSGSESGSSLDDLRPVLQCSDAEHANLVRELASSDPKLHRAAGLVGVLIGLALLVEGNLSYLLQRATWNSHFVWLALNISLVSWMLGVGIFWTVRGSRLLMRVQREFVEIGACPIRC